MIPLRDDAKKIFVEPASDVVRMTLIRENLRGNETTMGDFDIKNCSEMNGNEEDENRSSAASIHSCDSHEYKANDIDSHDVTIEINDEAVEDKDQTNDSNGLAPEYEKMSDVMPDSNVNGVDLVQRQCRREGGEQYTSESKTKSISVVTNDIESTTT